MEKNNTGSNAKEIMELFYIENDNKIQEWSNNKRLILEYTNWLIKSNYTISPIEERKYSKEEVDKLLNSFESLCAKYQSNKDWFPAKKQEWFEQNLKP